MCRFEATIKKKNDEGKKDTQPNLDTGFPQSGPRNKAYNLAYNFLEWACHLIWTTLSYLYQCYVILSFGQFPFQSNK